MEIKIKTQTRWIQLLQYILGVFIVIFFIASLFPGAYNKLSDYTLFLIAVQLLISLLRFQIIGIFLEIALLILGVLGLIPILGFLFRFCALIVSTLDLVAIKGGLFFQAVNVFAGESVKKKYNKKKEEKKEEKSSKNKKKFNSDNIKDAYFEEK